MGGTEIVSRSPITSAPSGPTLNDTLVEEHLDDLLDIQGIAVGGGGDALTGESGVIVAPVSNASTRPFRVGGR